jgi:hypothetical protein
MPKKQWFKLDTAGRMYSSIKSSRATTLFRLSADLTEEVVAERLQRALDNVMDRFPYFNVTLRRGVFWYYFDKNASKPIIEEETYYPCMYMRIKKKGVHPFRVLYFRKKIMVEFSHVLTDGSGAVIFLKALLFEYFKLSGIHTKPEEIFTVDTSPEADEFEDVFGKYFDEKLPKIKRRVRAFHFPFAREKKGVYNIVTGIMPTDLVLEHSRDKGVSMTEFLSAVYFDAIQTLIEQEGFKKRPIVLNIPVNLRKFFPSNTLRNFFISVTPTIDPRLGHYSFNEILQHVKAFMRITADEKYIRQQIRMNVVSEKTLYLRLVPLFIKDLLMPYIYKTYGEGTYTSGFSNIGLIKMPDNLEKHIDRFELYPPPSTGNTLKITVASYQNKVYLTFGSLSRDRRVEEIYFRRLREMGIPVKVESNR